MESVSWRKIIFTVLVHRILSNYHIDLSDFFICCVGVGRRSHRYAVHMKKPFCVNIAETDVPRMTTEPLVVLTGWLWTVT